MSRGKSYEVSESLAQQLRVEYENGDNSTVLAKRYGISKATVARNIRRVGGEMRTRTDLNPHRGLLGWLNS
jgi:Mor family transcriptional regulator